MKSIDDVAELLLARAREHEQPASVLKAPELRQLYARLGTLPAEERAPFGQAVNRLRSQLEAEVAQRTAAEHHDLPSIDITAPFDINLPLADRPSLLPAEQGSRHPLSTEQARVLDVFYRMGFTAVASRELDDDYHMFTSLNFPADHPARDEYDTFMTVQTDAHGHPLIAPAHTSIMQHRILSAGRERLAAGQPIASVIPGRVFRNEDLDARHEHTFYQFEGVYVDRGVHAGQLLATFKTFLSEYYQQDVDIRSQPFYFPFTEPSFELALGCPFCAKAGCHICSQTGWIELLGMGMIHPAVLREAGIDPGVYTGFAWGCGLERLVMMKYGIEDVRHFESGQLQFLRQFV